MNFRILHSIKQIAAPVWNQITEPDTPFFDHEFLSALENGGCLGETVGWMPRYLIIEDMGRLLAACPLYLKTNSFGEFIFDFGEPCFIGNHRADLIGDFLRCAVELDTLGDNFFTGDYIDKPNIGNFNKHLGERPG